MAALLRDVVTSATAQKLAPIKQSRRFSKPSRQCYNHFPAGTQPKKDLMTLKALLLLSSSLILRVQAQNTLFDFEDAPAHTSLPLQLSSAGVTAQFSSTGQGFSIQSASTMGFTPAGFSGNCIYPNSVYAADLWVSFSAALTDFSILYAPQELACDSSATMRATAYMDGIKIGSTTTNAQAGTWPSEILRFTSAQNFNRVVVHYETPPVTGGDWGPIFMADNMRITVAPAPIVLQPTLLTDGSFQLVFAHTPGLSPTVLGSTDPTHPLAAWTPLGQAVEISPGLYEFVDAVAANLQSRFYRVSSQ